MIQANELRIGNLIYINEVAREVSAIEPYGVTFQYIDVHVDTGYAGFENITPITITEEWLLKAGFEIKKNITNCITATILVDLVEIRVCSGFLDEKDIESYIIQYDGHGIAKCQYVHQLQNLYFALTGKELEFKL